MSLNLMYITNRPEIAQIAESSGVNRIFVDMEYIGKANRQGGRDSVKNHHTVEDARAMKQAVEVADVLVRVNPIHEATDEYCSSEEEIDAVVKAGADMIMLPFIQSVEEVRQFLKFVDGRTKTMLLIETPASAALGAQGRYSGFLVFSREPLWAACLKILWPLRFPGSPVVMAVHFH